MHHGLKVIFSNVQFEYSKPSVPGNIIKIGSIIAGETDAIRSILNQACIELDSNIDSPITLPLIEVIRDRFENNMIYTINSDNGSYDDTKLGGVLGNLTYCLKDFLNNNVGVNAKYRQYIDEFDEYIKVYNMDVLCYQYNNPGALKNGSTSTAGKSIIHFSSKGKDTSIHEILHAMGLKHSFSSKKQEYTYLAQHTDNIMDYSHWGQRPVARVSTWQWQWEVMQQYVDKINYTIMAKRIKRISEEKLNKLKEDSLEKLRKTTSEMINNIKL